MTENSINYDHCAANYEQRYSARTYPKVRSALLSLAHQSEVQHVLEVGCGTGHWLRELQQTGIVAVGLDPSIQMLQEARRRDPNVLVVCAQAEALPFAGCIFDVIFCVNAFRHFEQPGHFLSEASRVLKQRGTLAIVGYDPHEPGTDWYLYKYFIGTYERDLERYKPRQEIAKIFGIAGFDEVADRPIECLSRCFVGAEVLSDPFLQKDSTSQLLLLSDSDYAAGIKLIQDAIDEAKARNWQALFQV